MLEVQDQVTDNKGIHQKVSYRTTDLFHPFTSGAAASEKNEPPLIKERRMVEKGEEDKDEPGSHGTSVLAAAKMMSDTKLITTKENIINAAKKGNQFTLLC